MSWSTAGRWCARIMLSFGLMSASSAIAAEPISQIEFLGEARIDAGLIIDGSPVGGLSAITYDRERDLYYLASDDPSSRGPARFYTARIELVDGRLLPGAAKIIGMTVIASPSAAAMTTLTGDPEGMVYGADDALFISSEGQIRDQIAPFIRRFGLDGSFREELALPPYYRPTLDGSAGPRHNLVLESLALTPDRRTLFSAVENALHQDGPRANLEVGSPCRLLRFDVASATLTAEYLYPTEPVVAAAAVAGDIEVNGLVELLAIDDTKLLAMERSFSAGVGNAVRIYQIDLRSATDISSYPALTAVDRGRIEPVAKRLLLDLTELGIYLDNLEGMTFGPDLADGRRSLILVADDNFNPLVQVGQVLAFAVDDGPVTIEAIQGSAHRSPLVGRWVMGVTGVVTAVAAEVDAGFWFEDPEPDEWDASSRGLQVLWASVERQVAEGESVAVDGKVVERRRHDGDLPVTTLEARSVRERPPIGILPAPVRVGTGGRRVPTEVVEDDALAHFEPQFDGLDFWESLEGMRIVLSSPPVVGPMNRYAELTVLADERPPAAVRTIAGGVLLRPGDANPERLVIRFTDGATLPSANVGDRFDGDLEGILSYDYGTFRLLTTAPTPPLKSARRQPETGMLGRRRDSLLIASFNVHNLSARSAAPRFEQLARQLVLDLHAPDIVALQEIQDDSGWEDDGTVGAEQTLARLIAAVLAAGGPRYDYRQIDPVDKRDGGQPGANIRQVLLFDPARVDFADRGSAGAADGVALVVGTDGPRLSASPARLEPDAAAFAGDAEGRFSPSRKPLVAEMTFGDERIFLIHLHLVSKTADTGLFGAVQPPQLRSEDQRSQQARLVADFVATLLAADAQAAIVVLGDLNEHEFGSPLRILESADLANPLDLLSPTDRYTFVYNGNAQVLDHILVSAGLAARAKIALDIVHLNADFSDDRRTSDHDPIVMELRFKDRR